MNQWFTLEWCLSVFLGILFGGWWLFAYMGIFWFARRHAELLFALWPVGLAFIGLCLIFYFCVVGLAFQ